MKNKKLYLQIIILVVLIGVGIVSLTNSGGDSDARKASTGFKASAGEALNLNDGELSPPTDLEVYVE